MCGDLNKRPSKLPRMRARVCRFEVLEGPGQKQTDLD